MCPALFVDHKRSNKKVQDKKDQAIINAGLVGCKTFHMMQPTGFNSGS